MNLTSLTVYLVMQADMIRFGIFFFLASLVCWKAFFTIIAMAASSADQAKLDSESNLRPPEIEKLRARIEKFRRYGKRDARWVTICFVLLGAAIAFLPSTKTLAATYVVPAIASSAAVQKDFPELYSLAVGKLKEQLAPSK